MKGTIQCLLAIAALKPRAVDPYLRAIDRLSSMKMKLSNPRLSSSRGFEVFRFAVPVDSPGNQVLAFHQHIGSLVEDLQHVLFIVLAAEQRSMPAFI